MALISIFNSKSIIMKIWQRSTSVPEIIEKFTVGRDKEFDILLTKYDVGSIAVYHVG
jgi:hypothetical protein